MLGRVASLRLQKRARTVRLLAVGTVLFCVAVSPARAQPDRSPVDIGAAYTGEVVGVLGGGRERGVVYLDNVGLTVAARLDSVVSWSGLTAFAYGLGNQGGSPSALVGDAQATSNIEAPDAWRLYEAWLQQTVGDTGSLLVGLYDVNSEFDVNRTGSLFLNSSHGIGASFGTSGRNGPSIFPVTSVGARARVRLGDHSYAQAAVVEGVPGSLSGPVGTAIRFSGGDGVLAAAEIGLYVGDARSRAVSLVDRTVPVRVRGKVALGGWRYTTELREWQSVNTPGPIERSGGSSGLYALAEGPLLREPGTNVQGLSAFGRIGWATDTHNRFAGYAGTGLVYTGLIPRRPNDRVGVSMATARNGDAYMAARRRGGRSVTRFEISFEGTYAAPVRPWLTVVGDVQYVMNPNTDPAIPNAVVAAFRVVVDPPI